MELEGADGDEGAVDDEAFLFGVEDRCEFRELGLGRWKAQCSSQYQQYFPIYVSVSRRRFGGTKEAGRGKCGVDIAAGRGIKYIIALRTSPVGITPSFSPLFSTENSAKASLISFSSAPVILCSFASFDCRTLGAEASAGAGARRLAGWRHILDKLFPNYREEIYLPFQNPRRSAESRDLGNRDSITLLLGCLRLLLDC